MPLPPPRRRRDPRIIVVAAVTFGVAALVLMLVVIGGEVLKGERPEEEVAGRFLEALFEGRGGEVHSLATPGYRAVVFREDLARLSSVLADTVGDADVRVLGSERTPGSEPPESYVGYQGTSAVGTVEGVVVVVELSEGAWFVRDVSYRFPDATEDQVRELYALIDELNAQVAERVQQGSS